MSAPSVRAAALAFALSSWVEGLTQIRTVLLMPYLPRGVPADEQEQEQGSSPASANWTHRVLAWLKRSGREMDETERTTLAAVDVTTAFLILQTLGQPLLPFLLSPLLTALPLPRPTTSFKPIKWQLFLTSVILSLVHEAERVSVSLAVDCARKRREARNRQFLGEVYVGGGEYHHMEDENDDGEEPEECLICAGVGADTSLSQSISSISSMATTSASLNALGPLEAFCTNAPQKHVAHRSCFLSWHAAYRQQRMHLPPEQVELQNGGDETTRTYAATILDAAGFGHLSQHLQFAHEWAWASVLPSAARPLLTLADEAGDRTRGTSKCLATLRTPIPPCPGCRSSVLLHFFSKPASPQRTQLRSRNDRIKLLMRMWLQHWRALVTGRTVLYRLASQWSFVMALLSMMRVSGRRVHWTYV